jgi:hypothetical protein
MNLEGLKKMTAVELREIGHEQAGMQGTVGMKKEELITALTAWYREKGEWTEEHHATAAHAHKGKRAKKVLTKSEVKQAIRALKGERDKALAAKDAAAVALVRGKLKRHKRLLAGLVD